jgi:hypothetical protein
MPPYPTGPRGWEMSGLRSNSSSSSRFIDAIAACVFSGVSKASQCAENLFSDLGNVDLHLGWLAGFLVEDAEVPPQTAQGGLLVVQLEFDAPDRARLVAAVVEEILDRHFAMRLTALATKPSRARVDYKRSAG